GTNLLIPHSGPAPSYDDMQNNDEIAAKDDNRKTEALVVASNNRRNEDIVPIIEAAKTSTKYTLQPGDTIYMVRTTDNLEKIARRFHVSSQTIRMANQLEHNKVKPG